MTEPPSPILTLNNVRKKYRGCEALKGISLQLFPGELLGFFGPNGAGKTTMIRCISGLLKPDSGQIRMQVSANSDATKTARLGLVPQNLAVYHDLTVQQNLEVFGRLEGVTGRPLQTRIAEVLDWAALKDRTRSLVKTLSGGMQRRLNIACSVLHRPSVLLLDEPTVGVDPQSRERIYTDGKLPDLVRQTIGRPHRVFVRFDQPYHQELAAFSFDEHRTSAMCPIDSMQELPQVLAVLKQLDREPSQIDVRSFGLQDVFLALTGRSLRE